MTAIRLGLCCTFRDEPIKFNTTTAAYVSKLSRPDALAKLAALCLSNAQTLLLALKYCAANGIGSFRVTSQILPLKTHPQAGYAIGDLPGADEIVKVFKKCGRFAKQNNVRLGFHPDQFVVLNSQRPDVVASSIKELEYQAEVAGWIGADTLNVHGGGAYGDKATALAEFARAVDRLPAAVRKRLTVENDDKTYTPADLLPVCLATGVPLVYDAHHHRVHPDGMSVEEATEAAVATWKREPLFHLSSPINGWEGPTPERHHDFIDVGDFPVCWLGRGLTVEVEAKAKEAAVLKLKADLEVRTGPTG